MPFTDFRLTSHKNFCKLCSQDFDSPSSFIFISERELAFAICYRPSVCRLSVVCNARAPYSAGWNFQQCFFAVWHLSHPLTFTENFTQIVTGKPLLREGYTQEG